MHDNNGKPFIVTLYNVLLAPYLCYMLFSIIKLTNLGHAFLLNKGFCTVFFGDNGKNKATLQHIAQRKHALLVKTREKSK